jgi:hypothetical protein
LSAFAIEPTRGSQAACYDFLVIASPEARTIVKKVCAGSAEHSIGRSLRWLAHLVKQPGLSSRSDREPA